jgi:hypothetical protein
MEKGFFSMKEEPTGFAGGLWLMVIGICMGLGFAGGYLVASNEASTALKKKQDEWSAKSNAYAAQEHKSTGELAALKRSLFHKDEKIAEHLKKSMDLDHQLQDAKSMLVRERREHVAEMKQYEDIKLELNRDRVDWDRTQEKFEKAKQGFRNIKVELDAGRFKGLEESSGFQILSTAFESVPEKK